MFAGLISQIGGVLTGAAGKYIMYGVLAAGIAVVYYVWRAEVRHSAQLEIAADLAEQALAHERAENAKMKQILDEATAQIAALEEKKQTVITIVKPAKIIVENKNIEDGPVAPVLKQTIDALRAADAERKGTTDAHQ